MPLIHNPIIWIVSILEPVLLFKENQLLFDNINKNIFILNLKYIQINIIILHKK